MGQRDSLIPCQMLLDCFAQMHSEHWAYRMGAAERGCVDCSGAFVYAYRQSGKRIYHGSNRIARTEVVALLPISCAEPGMAAFKRRKPGEQRYALPAAYRTGGRYATQDINDYYHIGLIAPDMTVLNAQSAATGFTASPLSQWDCVGYLTQVDYQKEDSMTNTAFVTASSGQTVNLRQRPDKGSLIIARVPIGTPVQVKDTTDNWAQVTYGNHTGYMMVQYLKAELCTTDLLSRLSALEKRVAVLEGGM